MRADASVRPASPARRPAHRAGDPGGPAATADLPEPRDRDVVRPGDLPVLSTTGAGPTRSAAIMEVSSP